MAVTGITRPQTSIAATLSSLRKSFGTAGKTSKKSATAGKAKLSAPSAAELRRAAAQKTLMALRLGVTAKGYNYTALPSSPSFSRQI